MDDIRQYLLSIISAAVVAGIVLRLVNLKSAYGGLIKILAGLFVVLTVISPWTRFSISDVGYYFENIQAEAEREATSGELTANSSMRAIIIEQVASYIKDKALSLGTQLEVTVSLSDDTPPLPVSIRLKGDVSPSAKTKLKEIIKNDIGVPEDKHIWT